MKNSDSRFKARIEAPEETPTPSPNAFAARTQSPRHAVGAPVAGGGATSAAMVLRLVAALGPKRGGVIDGGALR